MKKAYRHGDIAFIKIDKIPEGLTPNENDIIHYGSGGNPHKFKGGMFYPKKGDNFTIGYFLAKDTKLLHIQHGENNGRDMKTCILPDGNYEVRKQHEITNEGMKEVID